MHGTRVVRLMRARGIRGATRCRRPPPSGGTRRPAWPRTGSAAAFAPGGPAPNRPGTSLFSRWAGAGPRLACRLDPAAREVGGYAAAGGRAAPNRDASHIRIAAASTHRLRFFLKSRGGPWAQRQGRQGAPDHASATRPRRVPGPCSRKRSAPPARSAGRATARAEDFGLIGACSRHHRVLAHNRRLRLLRQAATGRRHRPARRLAEVDTPAAGPGRSAGRPPPAPLPGARARMGARKVRAASGAS